jgi:hypothetical protein
VYSEQTEHWTTNIEHSTNHLIDESTNQLIHQSTNHLIDESTSPFLPPGAAIDQIQYGLVINSAVGGQADFAGAAGGVPDPDIR